MTRITIIGGGASGTLLTANLVRCAGEQLLEINLIERNEQFGGVAYGMAREFHLLNVPAAKMGAFPDDVEHFYKWLQANNYSYAAGDFVSRAIYCKYLKQILKETIENKPSHIAINIFRDEAIDVSTVNAQVNVELKSGEKILTDKVVLAFGNFLPPHVRTANQTYTTSPKYFQNPWSEEIPRKINPSDDVLTIGTGLTAIDVVSSLCQNNHRGKIFMLSTHGLLPAVHAPAQTYPSFQTEIDAQTKILPILKTVRQHVAAAEKQNNNWRAVIDSMRAFTPATWFRLSIEEKRRFMRHLQRRWDVSRHRMPPESAKLLQNLQTANQLQILRGRIKNIEIDQTGKFEITFGQDKKLLVDWTINCTGSQCNYNKISTPLVKNLVQKGEIKPDALSLGLEAIPDGNLIDGQNQASNKLYTFGTTLRGILWETTAMPEIRAQARALALKLLEKPKI